MLKHFVLLFFLACGSVFACDPEPGAQHFPQLRLPPPRIRTGFFKVHNRLNGLPHNEIRAVIEQDTGDGVFVVVGTQDHGIQVFDGNSWWASSDKDSPENKVKFPQVTVTSLVSVEKDLLYAGTPLGLVSVRISGKRFIADKIFSATPENLNVTDIWLEEDEQSNSRMILVACDRSAGEFINQSYNSFVMPRYLNPSGFNAVGVFNRQKLSGWSNGLFAANGSNLGSFFDAEDPCGWVTDLQTYKNHLYVSSANGVFKIDEKKKYENLLPGVWTTCLTFTAEPGNQAKDTDKQDAPAIADASVSGTDEYLQLQAEHSRLQADFQEYVNRNSGNRTAPQSEVRAMWDRFMAFEMKMQQLMATGISVRSQIVKGLWLGTKDSGIVVFSDKGDNYHLTSENSKLPSDNVTCITHNDAGEVWIGTENGGLLQYSMYNQSDENKEKLLLNCRATRIRLLSDLLFICTDKDGLYIFRHSSKASLGQHNSKTVKGFPNRVNDVAIDGDGNIWIAGGNGIWQWNGKKWLKVKFSNQANENLNIFRIDIDGKNRIFAASDRQSPVSENIFFYNGSSMVGLSKSNVAKILKLPKEQRKKAAELFGLSGDFMRGFDFSNASEALRLFDQSDEEKISAIMNTEHYLQIGTESGQQYIFDGESYKKLSVKGTGTLGPVRSFARLPEGEIIIQGSEAVSEFNGLHYKLINSPGTREINDLCLDSLNPETYRIAFKHAAQGGYALYQDPVWQKYFTDQPVLSLAQADKTIYMAKPDGIYYLEE